MTMTMSTRDMITEPTMENMMKMNTNIMITENPRNMIMDTIMKKNTMDMAVIMITENPRNMIMDTSMKKNTTNMNTNIMIMENPRNMIMDTTMEKNTMNIAVIMITENPRNKMMDTAMENMMNTNTNIKRRNTIIMITGTSITTRKKMPGTQWRLPIRRKKPEILWPSIGKLQNKLTSLGW